MGTETFLLSSSPSSVWLKKKIFKNFSLKLIGFLFRFNCLCLFAHLFLVSEAPQRSETSHWPRDPGGRWQGWGRDGGSWFCPFVAIWVHVPFVFHLLDLFSGPGYSPESSKYTVPVPRRLNMKEKQGPE